MKLKVTVLFYNEASIQKEKDLKLIHGENFELSFEEYSKRLCIFYNVDAIFPCEKHDKYSCLLSGGETFIVCMPFEKLEQRIEKALLTSFIDYSKQ